MAFDLHRVHAVDLLMLAVPNDRRSAAREEARYQVGKLTDGQTVMLCNILEAVYDADAGDVI